MLCAIVGGAARLGLTPGGKSPVAPPVMPIVGSLQMGVGFPAEHRGLLSTPLARTLRVAT